MPSCLHGSTLCFCQNQTERSNLNGQALRQAITSQGALLGQHDKVLSQVLSLLQELLANVVLLLGQSGSSLAAQATAAPGSSTAHTSQASPSFVALYEPSDPIPNCYLGKVMVVSCYSVHCFLPLANNIFFR